MPDVISVRFRGRGKAYDFDPGDLILHEGDQVVVETSKGSELGACVSEVHDLPENKVYSPLRPVLRLATQDDLRRAEQNRDREKNAFAICEERIAAHGLEMKLVDVEYSFDGNKILFFFTADGRVDFRELVKDLAATFHVRIELRQIGVRDGAKLLGGLGICGRPFCCSTFLEEFQPVSIKMAKTQALSLNPTKISGTCGRLMCCLKYEQEAYEDLIRNMPKQDAEVDTPKGKGTVTEVNLLRRTVKVRLAEGPDTTSLQSWNVDRLGYTLNGEYKEPIPEEPKPEEERPELRLPGWLEEGRAIGLAPAEEEQQPKRSGRNRNRNRKKGGPKPDQAQEAGQKQGAPKQAGQKQPQKPSQKQPGGEARQTQQPPRKGQPQGEGKRPQGDKKPQGEGKKPQAPREGRHQGGQNAPSPQGGQNGGKKSGHRPFYRSRKPKSKESQP